MGVGDLGDGLSAPSVHLYCVCVRTSLTQHNTWLHIDWILLLFILRKVMLKGGQLKNTINVLSSNLLRAEREAQRG